MCPAGHSAGGAASPDTARPHAGRIDVAADGVVIDGALLATLLGVQLSELRALMQDGRITSTCEEGVAEHDGQLRLTFFHGSRRACVSIDRSGRILTRSVIDFGSKASARAARPR